MTTKILDLDNIERKLFWIFSGALCIACAIYFYSAFMLMGLVVDRDKISSSTHEISAISGSLEQEYITLKNSITLTRAKELGFKEIPVKFSTRTSSVGEENLPVILSAR